MKTTSNSTQSTLAVIAGLSLSTSAHAVTLFADTFNRADSSDLNASATGKSGTLAASAWVEKTSAGVAGVVSNELQIGETSAGGGWAIAYVDHNFTDPSIFTSGSFTASLDLVGPISSGGGTRFTGFMVGNSSAEMSGWSSNNPTSTFTSDFFFGYDTTGTNEVKIFKNGTTQDYQQGINLDAAGATLSVTFSGITDFNSGSTVNYEAFIDGGSIKTGNFTWSGTNENYLGIYSNYTGNGTEVDNFSVVDPSVAVPEPSSTALLGLGGLALMLRRRR